MDPELDKSYMTVINEATVGASLNDWHKQPVLDKGYIEVIDLMGDDLSVVNAARVSFNKSHNMLSEGDEKLIKYLADHGHWSPFAHPKIQLRIKMPIFVHRQWDKTRVGFDRNEVSRRYVDYTPEVYTPSEWRGRPEGKIKQGSGPTITDSHIKLSVDGYYEDALDQYNWLIAQGVAPEQARIVLPLATYTEFIETGSLYGYSRLHGLRASEDAQWEIRQYANALDVLMSKLFPLCWKYLKNQPEEAKEEKTLELRVKSIEDILKDLRSEKYTKARAMDKIDITDELPFPACCYSKPESGYCQTCGCVYLQDDIKPCSAHREYSFLSR